MRLRLGVSCAALALFGAMLTSSRAEALELPKLWGKPLSLDVTEVSIVAQRFDSREVDPINEGGPWGQWINRLNATLDWNHVELGMRLDSAVYWNTLKSQCHVPTDTIGSSGGDIPCSTLAPKIARDDLARYQNSIYPAKLWASYKRKGVEVIVGDAYVQFARGLVLSMRKLDDLGLDNTIRGFKGAVTKGPFSVTLIGGLANPSRVDEASGQALFNQKSVPNTSPAWPGVRGAQPVFGADQLFGAEIQAGREKPVVLTTSFSYLNRCAPNAYLGPTSAQPGHVNNPDFMSGLLGYCDDTDVATWLGSLPGTGTIREARHVSTVAQALEIPKLGKFGSIYVVGVIQKRDGVDPAVDVSDYDQGTALYATYTGSMGKRVTNTIEFKDYRNFYPAVGSINATQVSAFSPVAYSAVPTIESITQDNMLNNFNICVDGVRLRTDVRTSDELLLYGQGIFSVSKGEQNATCNRSGDLVATKGSTDALTDYVVDGLGGIQWETKKSHVYATIGGRDDWLGTGDTFLYQLEATYNVSHSLGKNVAIEFIGRHRVRYEAIDNLGPNGKAEAWVEGENYAGLSIVPKWVFTQGFEYSTRDLAPNVKFLGVDYPSWLYLSLGAVYKFTKDSNIKFFVGQQRGGLKCISGVCRVFPPFEGARTELTLRF